MRRMWRLPFGERLLRFTPALSSSPGHAPTHETRFLAEAKVVALAPTSAMICCAESTPSFSYAPAAHDWTRLAPDVGFPTSGLLLPASRRLASSTAPAFPKPASSIARWIPSPLPRFAARSAIPPAVATVRGCFRTSVAQIGIALPLRCQPLLQPASFYVHRFPLSYRA